VFVPVPLLPGTARYLFTPLAMAVVFAMMASYLLSRTLVPTMMAYLLEAELEFYRDHEGAGSRRRGPLAIAHHLFNAVFERMRYRYMGLLDWSLHHRGRVLVAFMGFAVLSLGLAVLIGEDFFPSV